MVPNLDLVWGFENSTSLNLCDNLSCRPVCMMSCLKPPKDILEVDVCLPNLAWRAQTMASHQVHDLQILNVPTSTKSELALLP